MRVAALVALLAALPGFAQDLPDPGRRLTPEEQKAEPGHPAPKRPAGDSRRKRDEQACKNARIYYQNSCGAPGSYRAYSRTCAEAYALYRESCP